MGTRPDHWDSTALSCNVGGRLVLEGERLRFVESHISRKTSEIWGTRDLWSVQIQRMETSRTGKRDLDWPRRPTLRQRDFHPQFLTRPERKRNLSSVGNKK
jgi:hypothetical protein